MVAETLDLVWVSGPSRYHPGVSHCLSPDRVLELDSQPIDCLTRVIIGNGRWCVVMRTA